MKKILFYLAALAAVTFSVASCNKEAASPVRVSVSIDVADLAPGTKALKQNWEEGDKINIWFYGVSAPNQSYWAQLPHLVMTRSGGDWVCSDVDETLLGASGTFYAIYEASNSLFTSVINHSYAYFPTGTSFKHVACPNNARPSTRPLTCYANNVSYTYDSVSKLIRAHIADWVFLTPLQLVVTGLEAEPDRYAMSFAQMDALYKHIRITEAYYFYETLNASSVFQCAGPSGVSWANGTSNADGIAFYFDRVTNTAEETYTIYLVDKTLKKTYSYTKATKLYAPDTACKGVKIAFSSFTDVSATYPME